MKPPWTEEERIGCYPDMRDGMTWMDEVDGKEFEPKRLDMEGRAVVCDFGLFVLFNLYCPNETNDTRRPYKMNFLRCLQERVRLLREAGREVIIAGDINIMRAPIDSGEGGIRTSAEQHYEHPARRILDDWCAPKGDMVDVVRESWPDRDDMFTCWNQKLDARSANYGSRIDLILCTPGLRPWLNGGDILTKVYGSDHCPVYIDLHETIHHPLHGTLHLKDQLNPPDRPQSTAPVYPNDVPREAPEPPRFATKFHDEFSGRQTSLKSFFGGGGSSSKGKKSASVKEADKREDPNISGVGFPSPSPTPVPTDTASTTDESSSLAPSYAPAPAPPPGAAGGLATPFSLARAAFDSIDAPSNANASPSYVSPSLSAKSRRATSAVSGAEPQNRSAADSDEFGRSGTPLSTFRHRHNSRDTAIDMTYDVNETLASQVTLQASRNDPAYTGIPPTNISNKGKASNSVSNAHPKNGKSSTGIVTTVNGKSAQSSNNSQTKLSAFFSQPSSSKSSVSASSKRKNSISTPPSESPGPARANKSARTASVSSPTPKPASARLSPNHHSETGTNARIPPLSPETLNTSSSSTELGHGLTDAEDQEILQALAEADEERRIKNEQAKPVWSNLFAKKLPPLCTVHQKPCKDFLVMKPGPNKGKRFWLCSLPVGAGYDTGRSKRPREDVNRNFRCDFFLWDSANSRKETIGDKPSPSARS
ncbi:exodeoxyribonuclease III [Kwoniella heveanensis CBS 569]|nr:exodeoxyribonuclease III [Kwoniella heveanensis CBS 569]